MIIEDELLTAAEVGKLLKVNPRQVTERLILSKTFPKPVRLPNGNGGYGHPRWKKSALMEYIRALSS